MENMDHVPGTEIRETETTETVKKQAEEIEPVTAVEPIEENIKSEAPKAYTTEPEEVRVEETDEDEDIPTLYSERVIYTFSVLFSVIAGGILLARNLKEVNRKDGIPHVIAFSLIYTFLSGYLMTVSKSGLVGTVVLAIIGAMVLNSYFWNAYIGRGINYYRKSYGKALIIALIILIPLFLLAVWGGMSAMQSPADGMRID